LVEGRSRKAQELTLDQGDMLTTTLLPGLGPPLAAIFDTPA